jgi:phosphoribosyl 1,2-cyclic phosphate phosphodiesterase
MPDNKLIILGCGASAGVPAANNYWGACDPSDPRNFRTRSSAYVEIRGTKILIDTSPDLRLQMLKNQIIDIDAVLYTHAHADHTHGIDELRMLFFHKGKKKIPIYGAEKTVHDLQRTFSYLFHQGVLEIYPAVLEPNIIEGKFTIGDTEIVSFPQRHGKDGLSTGFRIGNMAYSTDFSNLDEQALHCLQGIHLWIIDCLSIDPRPTHLSLQEALGWIEKVQPKKAILTHMNTTLDYKKTLESLPSHIEPAYDGLTVYF